MPCDSIGRGEKKGKGNEIVIREQLLKGSNPSKETKATTDDGNC
jgi:hypothetical protein